MTSFKSGDCFQNNIMFTTQGSISFYFGSLLLKATGVVPNIHNFRILPEHYSLCFKEQKVASKRYLESNSLKDGDYQILTDF